MEQSKNNLIVKGGFNELVTMDESVKRYTTLDLSSKDNQVKMYNADTSCDIKLFDIKGQVLTFIDVYVEERQIPKKDDKGNYILNEKTGEVETKKNYRTILFGDDGKTYVSTAYGIYNSITKICGIFGNPSIDNPIKVEVSSRKIKNGVGESLILIVKE